MLSTFKPTIDKTTQQIVTPLKYVNPNLLTLIGIVPSILFFLLLINHHYIWALIIYLGNLFDLLDGAVAKRFHKKTAFGGFLDSTFDRISDFLIITSFAFAGIVSWPITSFLLLFSFLVSYARSRAELASEGKQSFAIGLIERTERLALIWLGLLLYIFFPDFGINTQNIVSLIFIILLGLSCITFLQRVQAAYRNL